MKQKIIKAFASSLTILMLMSVYSFSAEEINAIIPVERFDEKTLVSVLQTDSVEIYYHTDLLGKIFTPDACYSFSRVADSFIVSYIDGRKETMQADGLLYLQLCANPEVLQIESDSIKYILYQCTWGFQYTIYSESTLIESDFPFPCLISNDRDNSAIWHVTIADSEDQYTPYWLFLQNIREIDKVKSVWIDGIRFMDNEPQFTLSVNETARLFLRETGVFGDANQDGDLNVKDAQEALVAAGDIRIGLTPQISAEGISAADVDGDGQVTVKDAQYILVYYANTRAEIECSWQSVTGNPNAPAESNLI